MTSLARQHDCYLLDLDGTLFRGHAPTVGAVETLDALDGRALYVTNNATRSASEVAAHLAELGFTATTQDVVTSAQGAARVLAQRIPAGSRVLVVGTDALAGEVAAVGLHPVPRQRPRRRRHGSICSAGPPRPALDGHLRRCPFPGRPCSPA